MFNAKYNTQCHQIRMFPNIPSTYTHKIERFFLPHQYQINFLPQLFEADISEVEKMKEAFNVSLPCIKSDL